MLAMRQAIGRTGKIFEGLSGLSTTNNLLTIRNLFYALKPQRTLEIGLCHGGSCLVFTSCHRDLKRPPAHQHLSLDPFQTSVWDDAGLMIVEQAGLSGWLDCRS